MARNITLPFPPSSNTAYPTVSLGGKRTKRIKSKKLNDWIKSAPRLNDIKAPTPCTIIYRIFFPDNRPRDGQNYLKVTLDYLVAQEVLQDDNRKYVKGEAWIDCGTDKDNPRIEIMIKEYKDGSA